MVWSELNPHPSRALAPGPWQMRQEMWNKLNFYSRGAAWEEGTG